MAAPTIRLAGPAYLAASATNIYTPPTLSQGMLWTYITQLHLANVTSGGIPLTLYIGATGGSTGGTEIGKGVRFRLNWKCDDLLR